MTRPEVDPRDLKKHPTHPNWTMPKSWGVWEVPEGSKGKRYRYGNNPVRQTELENEFGVVKRIALYTSRKHAAAHALELNEAD